jgi:hypothetical protein
MDCVRALAPSRRHLPSGGGQSRFAQGSVLAATDSCHDGIGEDQTLVVLRARRGVVAAAALVAFNLLMFVHAAIGSNPMETPFLVAWTTGDAALTLGALALTERS